MSSTVDTSGNDLLQSIAANCKNPIKLNPTSYSAGAKIAGFSQHYATLPKSSSCKKLRPPTASRRLNIGSNHWPTKFSGHQEISNASHQASLGYFQISAPTGAGLSFLQMCDTVIVYSEATPAFI